MLHNQIYHLEHESAVLQDNALGDPHNRILTVYLPPDYEGSDRRYQTIWMLAPFTSWGAKLLNLSAWDENIVQRLDRLIRNGDIDPVVMAFPDAFTRYGGSQYRNSSATGRYEDYLIKELVPFLDQQVRTLPDKNHRAVMGYSSGGYAALMLVMAHSEVFSAVASHSGDVWFETCYWPDIPGAIRAFEKYDGVSEFLNTIGQLRDPNRDWWNGLGMAAMSACYTPNPNSLYDFDLPFDTFTGEIDERIWEKWQEADPIHAAPKHLNELGTLKTLYFDCGIYDEYNLFLGARRLHRLFNNAGIPHTYDEFDGGHRNNNWRYDISITLISKAIS